MSKSKKDRREINAVKAWMEAASTDEQNALADAAGTSRGHLYHLATGRRICSADLGKRLEIAADAMRAYNPDLPRLKRTDLCPACAACEYARKCGA